MLIFWVHILLVATTTAGLHALKLKKTHLFSHTADCSSPVLSRILASAETFCFASASPLKASSALIGQFKHTPSDEPMQKPSTL